MITLVCTKCGNTLTVDDGFAGGVCRCSKCGTIQTVPARGEAKSTGGQAIFERSTRNANGAVSKPANSAPAKPKRPSQDLETLSEIVTSSGLVGSGMLRQSRRPAASAVADQKRSKRAALLTVALGGVVAVIVGLWVSFGMGRPNPAADAASDRPADNTVTPTSVTKAPMTPINGPSFGPIALDASGPVIYLVDRGDATRAYTASLQRAVAKSAATLGASRKFQVCFWTADGETPSFPAAPTEATSATVAKLSTWLGEVAGGRATDASASLDAALAANPGEIVIITGKAWQLDDSFANEAIVKLGGKKVRIHGVALGGSSGSDALARVVAKTGGKFVEMDEPALASIGK